jgi:hypothetical protein
MSIDTYWSPVSPSVALSTSHRAFKGMSVSACIGDTCVDRMIISMGLNPDVFVPFQFLYFEIYSAPSVPECKHSGHSNCEIAVTGKDVCALEFIYSTEQRCCGHTSTPRHVRPAAVGVATAAAPVPAKSATAAAPIDAAAPVHGVNVATTAPPALAAAAIIAAAPAAPAIAPPTAGLLRSHPSPPPHDPGSELAQFPIANTRPGGPPWARNPDLLIFLPAVSSPPSMPRSVNADTVLPPINGATPVGGELLVTEGSEAALSAGSTWVGEEG